jgi:hypothetical protein
VERKHVLDDKLRRVLLFTVLMALDVEADHVIALG